MVHMCKGHTRIQVHSTIAISLIKMNSLFVCTSVLGFGFIFFNDYYFLSITLTPPGQIQLLAASIRTVFFTTHEQRLHNLSVSNSEDIGLLNPSCLVLGKKVFSVIWCWVSGCSAPVPHPDCFKQVSCQPWL